MNEYYISRENESEEDIEHYGVPGMKWGVRRYRNKDGSLTAKGKIKAKRAFAEEDNARYGTANKTVNRRKVAEKYSSYKTPKQKAADEKYHKSWNAYEKYVSNYGKTNRDIQRKYEHDYDHTRRGKKLLKEFVDSYNAREKAYTGEKWFWKYEKELAKASLKDYAI